MAASPNDPLFPQQWGLQRVNFPQAWVLTEGLQKRVVRVGLIDTGVAKHEDLPNFIARLDPDASDLHGHGTWVTGILCAERDNGVGIAGAISCELFVYKAFDKNGWNWRKYYDALEKLPLDGVQVVNLSIGGVEYRQTEQLLISLCVAAGVIVVAAAGNHRQRGNPRIYPGALDEVITVAATTRDDQPTRKSSAGPQVFIAAPGSGILTTGLHNNYRTMEGTSFAAPLVTAAITLALSVRPHLSVADIREALRSTVDDVSRKGKTEDLGYGILDVASFIRKIVP